VGIKDMLKPYILKPLGISLSVMFFMQFAGINAVLFNLAAIFKSTGSNLSDTVSSIVIAAVQVVATFGASLLMDRAGRKLLLIISAGFMALSHTLLCHNRKLYKFDKRMHYVFSGELSLLNAILLR
ncbi:unnamed protein product, partial [Meganyctiphanes norvegica]